MSKKFVILIIHHCHKLLDLIYMNIVQYLEAYRVLVKLCMCDVHITFIPPYTISCYLFKYTLYISAIQ
jgi:hypothetical protein